jgi:hypothetical protein
MVTTSTESCVSARSGAANLMKASEAISPTTLMVTSATRRWRCHHDRGDGGDDRGCARLRSRLMMSIAPQAFSGCR